MPTVLSRAVRGPTRPGTIALAAAIALLTGTVHAGEEIALHIKNNRFEPAEIVIPRDTKVRLVVRNEDATPEEFESYELNREKVVPANGEIVLFIGPLDPGTYPFFGEFHQDTAQGRIVVE